MLAYVTEIDSTDTEIMLVVTKGYSSSYSIWSKMKNDEKGQHRKAMTYRNTSKRIMKLFKMGLLDEIKPEVYVPHGRKDYRISLRGMEYFVPYILTHPDEMQNLVQYMDRIGLDKKVVTEMIITRVNSIIDSVNKYLRSSGVEALRSKRTSKTSTATEAANSALEELVANVSKLNRTVSLAVKELSKPLTH